MPAASDSEVVRYVSHIHVNENKLIQTDSIVIQINNAKGNYAAHLALFYSKSEKVTIEDAHIEDLSGNILRKLKKNEFTESNAVSDKLYSDRFVKEAELIHNRYPYRVVYSYQKTCSDFFSICHWAPCFFLKQDVRYARLIVDVPADNYPVRYKCSNISEPEKKTQDKRTQYTWTSSYKAVEREMYAPVSELKIPKVQVLPLHFKYGTEGSWESWTSFGNWISRLNKNTTQLPETEKQKVDELVSGISEPMKKARILYEYLQKNTRYINVSLKTGGLKSYPASYVAQNKYGDCKALSTYMIALLEHAGIKAYYTLVNADNSIDAWDPVDKNFPNQVFNHVIVTLPLAGDTLFLECTDKDIPFGYLGTFTQGRDVLVVEPERSFFARTPELQPESVLCSRSQSVFIGDTQPVSMDLYMLLRGSYFELLNHYTSNLHRSETEKIIRDYIYPGNYDFNELLIRKENPELPEISLRAKIQTQQAVKNYGRNWVLMPFSWNLAELETPENRTQGIRLNYPIAWSDTTSYITGKQQISGKKPDDIFIESPYGNYSVRFNLTDNQLEVIKKLLIFKGSYPIETYTDFYRFWEEVKSYEKKNYYLEKP